MFRLLHGYYLSPSIITLDPVYVPFSYISGPKAGSGLLLSPAYDYNCVCFLEYQVLITWHLTARILSSLSPSKRPGECLLTMGGRVFSIACFF